MNTHQAIIEALLFVSHSDVLLTSLSSACGISLEEVELEIQGLQKKYSDKSGIVIIRVPDKVRLATNPLISEHIANVMRDDVSAELTRPQLETLTIVAYRGPIMKTEIEMIRGVNCTLILRNLLMRGLVDEIEGTIEPSYAVSTDMMSLLGITQVNELPEYDTLAGLEVLDRIQDVEH